MKKWLMLFSLLFLSGGAWADEALVQPSAEQIKSTKILYRLATLMSSDADESFRKQKINVEVCTYQSDLKQRSNSYRGLGPCLFEAFIESMRTPNLSGRVYAWGSTPWGKINGLRIEWRPVQGGWLEMLRSWLDLKLERFYQWQKSDTMLSQQTLLGEMKLFFPQDFPVQNLDMKSHPVRRHDGILEFQGTFQISSEKYHMENTLISWETNINPLRTTRKFYFRAHGDYKSKQAQEPSQESLP